MFWVGFGMLGGAFLRLVTTAFFGSSPLLSSPFMGFFEPHGWTWKVAALLIVEPVDEDLSIGISLPWQTESEEKMMRLEAIRRRATTLMELIFMGSIGRKETESS